MMKIQTAYQIDCLSTQSQLNTLEHEWATLINGIPGVPIFLTWEWIKTWWECFGANQELWLLTARDAQSCLVGIAPLMLQSQRAGLVKLRRLAIIGSGSIFPVHLNFLVHNMHQDAVTQAFIGYLFNQSNKWDIIGFDSVAQDSAIRRLLLALGGRTGEKVVSPYIPLPGSWDIYRMTLTKKLRRNLKYFLSRLESDHPGDVRFDRQMDLKELPEVMKRLEELNQNRRHDQGLASAFDDPMFCRFHSEIARVGLERGWLRLYKLSVDNFVIALYYCFRFQDRIYAYQMGFDIDWREYSPGRLLIAHGVESSIKEGASELDWLAGEDEYKMAWTEQVREEYEILYSRNWIGGAWIRWKVFQELLRKKAKQWLPQSAQERIKRFIAARPGSIPEKHEQEGE